jgi:hypothetical protein
MADLAHLAQASFISNPLSHAVQVNAARQALASMDILYGGAVTITDVVKVVQTPVSRKVYLYDYPSGRIARSGWSDSSGNIVFSHLAPGRKWFAVAFDHTGTYPPVSMRYST